MGKTKVATTKKKNGTQSFEITKSEINERQKDLIGNMIVEKVNLSAKNDSQKKLLKSIKDNQITICAGPAGSGKTICAIYMALSLLKERSNFYQKILLVKSVTVLKNEELGFLKGDLREKVDPYMESFKSNAKKLFSNSNVDGLFDSSIIHFLPLAYIRGTNLDNAIIILDETQNVSVDNARTLLTRIGENSKIICLGDTNQIDLRNKQDSSLEVLLKIFNEVPDMGCISMDENDENCRNPIIKTIESKFKEHYNTVPVVQNSRVRLHG
jgi:phosphate starvation-inducible PhoH-like protein